ncbi:MAG: SHOCT domain-containing protein [Bacilli bacterium]|nr:SHOCT domain-containing protein [Bacilli bacterium]
MSKTVLYEAKYSIGTEIKTLKAKNIKDGLIMSDSKGVIESFDDKKNTYKVSVSLINGDKAEADYKEEELILADLSKVSFNEEVLQARELNKDLSKKNLIITSIGCGISILIVIAAVTSSLFIDAYNWQMAILATSLVLVIAIAVIMLVLTNKNTKTMHLLNKRIEKIAIEEQKLSESNRQEEEETFDKINKLKSLYDSGAITEKEYKARKKQLLDEITK